MRDQRAFNIISVKSLEKRWTMKTILVIYITMGVYLSGLLLGDKLINLYPDKTLIILFGYTYFCVLFYFLYSKEFSKSLKK